MFIALTVFNNNHEIRVGRGAINRPHNVVNGSYRTKFINGYG